MTTYPHESKILPPKCFNFLKYSIDKLVQIEIYNGQPEITVRLVSKLTELDLAKQ